MQLLKEFFWVVVDILVYALAVLICGAVVSLVFVITGHTIASGSTQTDRVVKTIEYSDDISDQAIESLFYSSELGVHDGGMRNSTLSCYRYVGDDITVIDRYDNSVGMVHVITANKKDLYIVIDEVNDSYVMPAKLSYDEYRGVNNDS